jgi:hypothetical protein
LRNDLKRASELGGRAFGAGDRTQAENEAERDELWESTLCEKREKAKDPFIVCAALGVVLMGLFWPAATKITSLPRNNYDDFVRLELHHAQRKITVNRQLGVTSPADRRLLHLLFQWRCQIHDD